jgi:hypothetical protein
VASRKLIVEFIGDTNSLDKAFKKVDKGADTSRGKMAAFGAGIAKAGRVAGPMGLAASLVGGKLVSLASDAEETASKFKIVFGRETENATKKLDAFSKATGTSKFALKEQAAGFQALIRPMGLGTKGASDMSVGLTKLATDLASFNNTSVQDAIIALQSGLVGESEPLRRFGVQLSAARIETFAYAKGIAKQGAELTSAQKAQASYGLILKDTTLAQGDAVRTSDSFANQWKRLKSQATDLATELGVKLLPVVTSVIKSITGFIDSFRDSDGTVGGFGTKIAGVWGTVKAATESVVGFLSGEFEKHKGDIQNVSEAVSNLGTAIVWVWEHVALPVVERVLPAIEGIVKGGFNVIGGLVKVLSSILTGDFRAAWNGVKQIFSGAIQVILNGVRGSTAPFREAFAQIGTAINNVLGAAWEKLKGGVRGVVGWLGERWVAIRETASTAWQGIKDRIVGPIGNAIDWVKEKLGADGLAGWLRDKWGDIAKGAGDFAANMKDRIVGAFEGAVNRVIDFINLIIKAINIIPGVPDIKPLGHIGGNGGEGGNPDSRQGFAKGGAFARTGGLVTNPITLMGEEAPRHPEFVIPTNPAYRKRAQKLAMAAGSAVGVQGFKIGGVFGDVFDTALKLAQGPSGFLTDLVTKGPGVILDKLPNPNMLGWLEGMGGYVIDKVSGWIKNQVENLIGGAGGKGSPVISLSKMIAKMNAIDSKGYPYSYGGGHNASFAPSSDIRGTGAFGYDCSGLVSAILHAGGLTNTPMSTDPLKTWGANGPGKWVTIGVRGSSGLGAHTMMKLGPRYLESGSGHGAQWTSGWSGAFPINRHPAGFARGGMWGEILQNVLRPDVVGWGLRKGGKYPFVGAYEQGGAVAQTGMGLLHEGETVLPRGATIVLRAELDLGRGIKERVRVEFDEFGRQVSGGYLAGVSG